MRRQLTICFLFVFTAMPQAWGADRFNIAIIQDGPLSHELIPLDLLESEIETLLGQDYDVEFLDDEHGSWSSAGAQSALRAALNRSDVDAVVTLGLLGSAAAAQTSSLQKPVISVLVGDVRAQNFPRVDGTSGKRNFVYLDDSLSIAAELQVFHGVTGFRHVAVLADSAWLEAFPSLTTLAQHEAAALGAEISFVPVTSSAVDAVDGLPANADAVYATWLLRFTPAEMERLAKLLSVRRLLSFASAGRSEVEAGLLMTASADAGIGSLARRVAIVLQRIALGTPASTIGVDFQRPQRLAFNLATARDVDFAPAWHFLEEADLIEASATDGEPLAFVDALNSAVGQNRELAVTRFEPELARSEVRVARAPLLPQITLGANASRVKSATARVFELAEDSSDAELTASQVIYSERAYADLSITKHFARATDFVLAAETLDTVEAAAVAYFDLLRAYASREVQRRNLGLSRDNLRLAEVRLRVGLSDRSDVLRWESRVARERADVYFAQAQFEQAQTELARIINRRFDQPVTPEVGDIGPVLEFISSNEVQRYVNDPLNWEKLQAFYRHQALDNAPELKALDAEIAGLARERRASRREFFVPDIELTGFYGRNLDRSGAGSEFLDANLDDSQWTFGIRATLPLVSGGARRAQMSRASAELLQARARRDALAEQLEARASAAAQRTGGSYPAIGLAEEANRNARAHLQLVQDQYSKGAVNVTALIDAQDAALEAALAEAQARFAFLIDLAQLFRAAGDFSLFFDADAQTAWLDRIQHFYANPPHQEHR